MPSGPELIAGVASWRAARSNSAGLAPPLRFRRRLDVDSVFKWAFGLGRADGDVDVKVSPLVVDFVTTLAKRLPDVITFAKASLPR